MPDDPISTTAEGAGKVAELVGMILGPSSARRQAKADAEAEVIRAEGEAKADVIRARGRVDALEVLARAQQRLLLQQVQQQGNLEATVDGAARLLLSEGASPMPPHPDWVAAFVAGAERVSDEEMRSLWARILKSEAVKPGSFSRRTLAAVSLLSREEAELFTRFCSYVVTLDGHRYHLMPDSSTHMLEAAGLSFTELRQLDSCGLIDYLPLSPPWWRPEAGQTMATLEYHGRAFDLDFGKNPEIRPLIITLTSVGQELAAICSSKADDTYLAACLKAFEGWGIQVSQRTSEVPRDPVYRGGPSDDP